MYKLSLPWIGYIHTSYKDAQHSRLSACIYIIYVYTYVATLVKVAIHNDIIVFLKVSINLP